MANIKNFPFYKTKLRIMILTFHILKLSGYHNINIYILILIFCNIKLNCYYKTKLLIDDFRDSVPVRKLHACC